MIENITGLRTVQLPTPVLLRGNNTGNSAAGGDTCSENELNSSKETYPIIKTTTSTRASSSRVSSTNAPTSQFSFKKPEYSRQSRQSYYRNSNSSRYGSHSHNNRSGWQAGACSSSGPSYQAWTGSNSAEVEEEEVASAYNEEEEAQVYQPHSGPIQEIDPVVALERMCNWLGDILRKPDLARKLAGARLELGKDEQGENKATFWLADEGIDLRSFSLEYKSLIRMAFSTEVAPHYKLQLANGEVVVTLE